LLPAVFGLAIVAAEISLFVARAVRASA